VIALAAFALAAATASYLEQREVVQATEVTAAVKRQNAALQDGDARTIASLTEIRDDMAARLAAGERRLREAAAERDRALQRVRDLEQEIEARDARLANMIYQGATLSDQLARTEARLIEISDQRDADQRNEATLRWRLANIQTEFERQGDRQALAENLIEGWVLGNLTTLEELVAGTGVDVETLVARVVTSEEGQGGPLEAIIEHETLPLADDIARLTALQKVTSSLPLSSPLDQFHLTSTYGKRQDPFTKGWAFHSGLDMGAPPGSKVLATAPGIVTVAGPSGPYGKMVEIDHGMGVITRYGHLKSVAVAVGDTVGFRQNIGVIGSSGRSTSLHLHYEVRVDGTPHDPGRFLDAGRYLVAVFDLGERGMQWLQERSSGG
jgi:murein DD-endopeptidase MepM/ murein hydrolase activator NlpD